MNDLGITAENYEKDFVLKLAKPGGQILKGIGLNSFGDLPFPTKAVESADLLHMAIGVVGEVIELQQALYVDDDVNIREELGDILFYLVGMRAQSFPEFSLWNLRGLDRVIDYDELLLSAGNLLDQVKKFIIYNDQSENRRQELRIAYSELWDYFIPFLQNYFNSTQEAIDENVRKLSIRYAQLQYSDEAAKLRADKNPE